MLNAPEKLYPLPQDMKDQIEQVLKDHAYERTQLIEMLLAIQALDERHYVPEPVAYFLAARLDIPVAEIYDCLRFYRGLHTKPRAKYPIQICNSIACSVNNAGIILATLKELLGIDIGEVTYDGRFTIEKVSCLGACDEPPAVRVNGRVYGHLDTAEKVKAMLRSLE